MNHTDERTPTAPSFHREHVSYASAQVSGAIRTSAVGKVDGPLSPWAASKDAKPAGFVEHRFRLAGWSRRRPLCMWLNPAHGPALMGLAERTGVEFAWTTNWEHQANTMMGRRSACRHFPSLNSVAGCTCPGAMRSAASTAQWPVMPPGGRWPGWMMTSMRIRLHGTRSWSSVGLLGCPPS